MTMQHNSTAGDEMTAPEAFDFSQFQPSQGATFSTSQAPVECRRRAEAGWVRGTGPVGRRALGARWLLVLAWVALTVVSPPARGAEAGLDDRGLLEWLRGPAGPAGFCAQIGCGDGRWTVELARCERLAVHGLDKSPATVEGVRRQLEQQGLAGKAALETWTDSDLPYADNLINVLVVETPGWVTETELFRALTPLGVLCQKRAGRWELQHKPWPADLDGWTHWRHGADGNMVSKDRAVTTPTGLRWVGGPVQDPGGRKWYYDHVLVSAAGRNFYQYESNLVARDSFNGRLLWDRPAVATIFKETGTLFGLKLGTRLSKVRPVASADRLYAVAGGKLVALDAATGQPVRSFCEVAGARELALLQETLLLSDSNSLRAFKLDGSPRWQKAEAPRRFVAGEGKVFFVCESNVVGLNLADGAELWRTQDPKAPETCTCTYYGGVLILERSAWRDDGDGSGVIVFSGANGQRLWASNYTPGQTHFKEARAFFAQGLVWLEVQAQTKPVKIIWSGMDPLTGEPVKEWGTRGLHCSTPVATERCLIAPEIEFTDLETGARSRARMARSACRLPFVPANGLLNTFPVQCECFPMLRGYMGLAQSAGDRKLRTPRLQKGPAWNRVKPESLPAASPADWPLYRHDAWRTGSTPASLPEGELKVLWETQVADAPTGLVAADWEDDPFVRGLVTPPVCAAGVLVSAVPHRHQVVALEPATGARRWTFTAGGRVDTPPSIGENLCVFGCHDGYIYAVAVADGQLVWRFRAAPFEARIAAYGQLESPWPVAGSVLLEAGVAYACAGRHPASDGGLRVVALRTQDGRLLWEKLITDMGVKNWYSAMLPNTKQKVGVDYEPVDLLARDGDRLAMSRWRFDPKDGQISLAFTSTNYEVFDGLEIPRGIWGYGIRQTKQVLRKAPTTFSVEQRVTGGTNDTALLLAGPTLVVAGNRGELRVGPQVLNLKAPVVHDGLIAALGRLHAVTRDGRVYGLGRP